MCLYSLELSRTALSWWCVAQLLPGISPTTPLAGQGLKDATTREVAWLDKSWAARCRCRHHYINISWKLWPQCLTLRNTKVQSTSLVCHLPASESTRWRHVCSFIKGRFVFGLNSRIIGAWKILLEEQRSLAEQAWWSCIASIIGATWCNMVQLYQARTGPETLVSHSCPSNSSTFTTNCFAQLRWSSPMLKMLCKLN